MTLDGLNFPRQPAVLFPAMVYGNGLYETLSSYGELDATVLDDFI